MGQVEVVLGHQSVGQTGLLEGRRVENGRVYNHNEVTQLENHGKKS